MNHFIVAASRQSAAISKKFQIAAFCRKPLRQLRAFCCHRLLFPVVFVSPVVAQTNELPTLVPAYGEIPPTFGEQYQVALIVGSAFVVAYVCFVLKVMLRPESPVILSAEVVARQALMTLQNRPEDGKVLSAVSQILRRCASETFQLSDRELTTSEFCAAIEASPQTGAELAADTASFLHECDARKFSPAPATAPLEAVKRALELVKRIEKRQGELMAQPPSEHDRRI